MTWKLNFLINVLTSFTLGRKQFSNSLNRDYKPKPSPNEFGRVIFYDDFNTLDDKIWQQGRTSSGGGNFEFQFYNDSRQTSYIEDGKLHIRPILTSEYLKITDEMLMKNATLNLITDDPNTNCTDSYNSGCYRETEGDKIINPAMSSQIRSLNSFFFKYGKLDVVAKMPKGDWLWPAIWLMPKYNVYGGWPTSGEIDLIESRGNTDDCYGDGVSTVSSALHWGLNSTSSYFNLTYGKHQLPQGTFNDQFHKFTLEWTPEYLRTWVDDQHLIMDISFNQPFYKLGNFTDTPNPWSGRGINAPFDQEFFLIFNVAVGGTNGFITDTRDPIQDPEIYKQCQPKYESHYKPYNNTSPTAPKDFLLKRNQWEPTWNRETDQSHMVIDSVKVTEYRGSYQTSYHQVDYQY